MKKKYITLSVSGTLTIIIMAVMNLWLLPTIETGTQGMRFFDMNPLGYTTENALIFLSSLSDEGKNLALHIQLPLDFVYPIAYTVFFILLIEILTKKKSLLMIIPAFLFVSDYTENICSVIMLKSVLPSESLIAFAGTVTIIKSILMYLIFLILIILIIRFFIVKIKSVH